MRSLLGQCCHLLDGQGRAHPQIGIGWAHKLLHGSYVTLLKRKQYITTEDITLDMQCLENNLNRKIHYMKLHVDLSHKVTLRLFSHLILW